MTAEPSNDKVRFLVRYLGKVQGVGFRMTAVSLSEGLDVHGTVRNEHDGTVKLDVEGTRQQVDRFLKRIERAMSDNIQRTEIDERPLSDRSGGLRIVH